MKCGSTTYICDLFREKEYLRGIAICLYQFFKKTFCIFKEFLEFYEKRKQKFQNTMNHMNSQTKK